MFPYLIILQLASVYLGALEGISPAGNGCKNYHSDAYNDLLNLCGACQAGKRANFINACERNCFDNADFNDCLFASPPMNAMKREHAIQKIQSINGGVKPSSVTVFFVPPRTTHEANGDVVPPRIVEPRVRGGPTVIATVPQACGYDAPELYGKLDSTCLQCQESILALESKSRIRRGKDEIYTICKSNCFQNSFFDRCLIEDTFDENTLRRDRDYLNGKNHG